LYKLFFYLGTLVLFVN